MQSPTTPLSPRISSQSVVAIGDVHGCASLLQAKLEQHRGSGAEVILLGDLIDRSPEANGDRRVLELVWAVQHDPGAWGLSALTVLRGNHEQMLLNALAEEIPGEVTELWEWNGGNPELLPFARRHLRWFAELPFTAIRGKHLFVHAGVRPGIQLEEQADEDLIWIRRPFLNRPHGLPYVVVHGHSITKSHQIDHRPHRINLDTGAFVSGVLSSLVLEVVPQASEETNSPKE